MKVPKKTTQTNIERRFVVITVVHGKEGHEGKDCLEKETLGTIRIHIPINSGGEPHVIVPQSQHAAIKVGDSDISGSSAQPTQ